MAGIPIHPRSSECFVGASRSRKRRNDRQLGSCHRSRREIHLEGSRKVQRYRPTRSVGRLAPSAQLFESLRLGDASRHAAKAWGGGLDTVVLSHYIAFRRRKVTSRSIEVLDFPSNATVSSASAFS